METVRYSRRSLLTGASAAALALPVAGCFGRGQPVDVNAVVVRIEDVVTRVQQFAAGLCSTVIPTATTLTSIILAIIGTVTALPAEAAAIDALAQQAAKAFCDAIAVKLRAGVVPRFTGARATSRDVGNLALIGAPIVSYGPTVIGKNTVDIQVIQPQ